MPEGTFKIKKDYYREDIWTRLKRFDFIYPGSSVIAFIQQIFLCSYYLPDTVVLLYLSEESSSKKSK